MSLDVIYRLSPQTPGVQGAVVNRDGERVGTTPFDTLVRTTTLAQNGGTYSYTSEKTGYLSNVQYKLFLIRNPYFDLNERNNPRREIERVFFEYGPNVVNFNATFNKSFPEFTGTGNGSTEPFDTKSLFDPETGLPTNNENIESEGSNEPYSNVPSYVIAVLKYVNNILDDTYTQLASNFNEILLEFNLTVNNTGGGNTGGGTGGGGNTGGGGGDDGEPPRTENVVLEITTNVTNSVRLFRNNDPSSLQVLTDKLTNIISLQGDVFRINSTDNSIYRIKSIRIGNTVLAERENENQSVNYEFTLNENTRLQIDVEIVSQTPQVDIPQIEFVNGEYKKFNKNVSEVQYVPVAIRKLNKVDSIRVVIGDTVKTFSNLGNDAETIILLNKESFTALGKYTVRFIPKNEERGDGAPIDLTLDVVAETWVGVPDIRQLTYPNFIKGADFVGLDVNFEISYESINTDYVRLKISDSSYTSQLPSTGKVTLNYGELIKLGGIQVNKGDTTTSISLELTPYNTSGIEVVTGRTEIISIVFELGKYTIPNSQVANRFVDAFLNGIDFNSITSDSAKLLTHNLHLGEGDNKVISNWTGSENTLILKLYEPLPTAIQENQQVWISKLQSNPIVETVTLSGDEQLVCSPLKGPNFSLVPDNGIGYKIYDDLIASGSPTSDLLINKYFEGLNIDTTKLDIQYTSGSTWLFENFINFGSAEERVNNFYYKVQLIETYVSKLDSLTDGLELGQLLTEKNSNVSSISGYQATSPVLFTEDEIFTLEVEQRVYRNPTERIEASRVLENLRNLLASFDGFENFLYSSTNPLSYPKITIPRPLSNYPIVVLKNSLDPPVIDWRDNLLSLAAEYDRNNVNYLVNNIPLFVKEDVENSQFLLFFDMIGQHFDVLWVYMNALKKLRKNDEAGIKGVPKEFVHTILKSFGWDGIRAYDSQFLWEYALGQTKEGEQKYSTSLEDANNQIWKRILNNLPYLLKHKGTARAMKAIMATYGVPQTMLTIMEFGGPIDPESSGTTDFTFDDRTAALNLYASASVDIPWQDVNGEYPYSIEFMIKPYEKKTSRILSSDNFTLDIIETGSKVYLEFDLDGNTTQSVPFPLATDNYSGILVSRNLSNYEVLYKTSDGERIYVDTSLQLDTVVSSSWETDSLIKIGNDFTGALDEVRLWRVPLEETKFENHVLFPNAINGNTLTSSTADLLFRLDFEYPLDFVLGTSTVPPTSIKNVSINTSYGISFASASNFSQEEPWKIYPYNYEPYERTVTTKVPSLGYNYANKIRTEDQTLIGNLSYKKRATKKSFDRAPIDSNRLGIFFSPIKELNMDIVKSLGDFNIDNYIGDPRDEYKTEYKELATVRNYYFERISRNSHEYIRLVKYISKSLFDVLASLAPARAKVSKGLLIEPHFLERAKTKWEKPNSLRGDYLTEISASKDVFFDTQRRDYLGLLDAEQDINLFSEERFFNTTLDVEETTTLVGDERFFNGTIEDDLIANFEGSYPTYTASIFFELTGSITSEYDSLENFTSVGTDPNSLAVLGFGLFANDTTTIWKRFDKSDNTVTQSRSDIYLLEETFTREVPVQVGGWPTLGSVEGDPVVVDLQKIPYIKQRINILPFGSPEPSLVNKVTKVTPLQGYFPTHYRYVNGLSTGLERSFFEGSKQTIDTTPDGLSPVETFTTNPNILRVVDTGRGSGEPILEVD